MAIEGSSVRELPSDGPILGYFDNPSFDCCEYTLGPGEWVLFPSDGVTEAEDGAGEVFAPDEFARVLDHGLSLANNLYRCVDMVLRHCGDGERDDITIGLIRGLPSPVSMGLDIWPVPAPGLAAHARASLGFSEQETCAYALGGRD